MSEETDWTKMGESYIRFPDAHLLFFNTAGYRACRRAVAPSLLIESGSAGAAEARWDDAVARKKRYPAQSVQVSGRDAAIVSEAPDYERIE